MKKWFALVVSLVLLLTLAACSESENTQPNAGEQKETITSDGSGTATSVETESVSLEDWGVYGRIDLFKDLSAVKVEFKWPGTAGSTAGTGEAADQLDGTMVLVDRYMNGDSPMDIQLKEFYPAYTEQTEAALKGYYGHRYENGKITVGEGELSTIGEYEVCRYAGKHTFEIAGTSYERQFVVYATIVKKNGAFVYWLVEDMTADQSAGKLLDENGRRIIQSIKEN